MKKLSLLPILILIMSLSSCELAKGIFNAGMAVGIIAVVVVVGLVIFLISKMFGGK